MLTLKVALFVATSFWTLAACNVIKTKVAVLGGGMTGIIAARTLHEQGIQDFVIIEARSELGGRMQDVDVGNGFKVELGPNWVQGLGEGATQNPIFGLARKNGLKDVFSDFSNLTTFDHNGHVDMTRELNTFTDAFASYIAAAGTRISLQQGDLTARAGLSVSGYKPLTYLDDAAEYFTFDFEYAQPPEASSFIASAENNNFTFVGFSAENNLVVDQRGFKIIALTEAATFLNATDSRLMLNHTVTTIKYSSIGVTIETKQGVTIEADYAITTFSVGVLQNADVKFVPSLPPWKQEAIDGMNMATYTKIFLRFNTTFWADTQYQIYADPSKRGYFSVWQSLDLPDFLPGSHVLFSTVTDRESVRIERQSDEQTQAEMMTVLRAMYKSDIPEPEEILFKRWHSDPLFRGSYSNWGTSYPPALFDHLRAPLETRLWFAGEATSYEYYGFLQGAYFEGMNAATLVVGCLHGNCSVSSKSNPEVVPACGRTFLEENTDLLNPTTVVP
ncbi:putative flavin-containing polyamine oxidase [Ramaria rubella]|nr:putative flavin-containing polyamine oxidase [Ramaria rubella]